MSDYKVSLVPTEHVDAVWPAVEPFIEGALQYASGKYELEDVHSLLVDYGYPLWIAFDDRAIKGAAITRFIEYPRKKCLFVEFCGGVDGWRWKAPLLDTLRSWARDNGCDAIEASGRVGWARVFREDGSKVIGQTFEIGI